MIGRKEKSKEKKYREDETDNDNINLKDSPKLIKVLNPTCDSVMGLCLRSMNWWSWKMDEIEKLEFLPGFFGQFIPSIY